MFSKVVVGCNNIIKEASLHHPFIMTYRFRAFFRLLPHEDATECVYVAVQHSGAKSIFCLIRVSGTLTSIVVALHRWVPANQPSVEHWSISTSCRLMSTRTTPLQDKEDTVYSPAEELLVSVQWGKWGTPHVYRLFRCSIKLDKCIIGCQYCGRQ